MAGAIFFDGRHAIGVIMPCILYISYIYTAFGRRRRILVVNIESVLLDNIYRK